MKYIKTPWLAIAVNKEPGSWTTIEVHLLNEKERKGEEPFFCPECDTSIVLARTEAITLIDMLSDAIHIPIEEDLTPLKSTRGVGNDE